MFDLFEVMSTEELVHAICEEFKIAPDDITANVFEKYVSATFMIGDAYVAIRSMKAGFCSDSDKFVLFVESGVRCSGPDPSCFSTLSDLFARVRCIVDC
jgi:hypothetical protein